MRFFTSIAVVLLLTATVCSAVPEGDVSAEFAVANRLYDQGKFIEAAAAYQKIAEGGEVSPALCFNQGNAFFKSGQLGRAIAAYSRAEQLAPRDADVSANLQFARNQVQGPTQRANFWQRQLHTLNLNEWTWLASGAVWLTFLSLAAIQFRPAWRQSFRNVALVAGCAALVLCGCLGLALTQRLNNATAVVTVHDLNLHTGPFEEAQSAFTAHDGAELQVLDHKDDWFQVSDGAGRVGWVRRDNVVLANPS